ncbi:hypothetical protein BIW11_03274 [Tropilaelaps mercedesae]|uniref:Uncharacterized protein n=1 Tax=Tropilaelaps mercedesae TaxID=418985 RepID=A0A1V9XP78_9ACAR|nr:hypothetical protein BIW11_03274 [Tropilaelaps mercedesae]
MSFEERETDINIMASGSDDPLMNELQQERAKWRSRNGAPIWPAELRRRKLGDFWTAVPFIVYWIVLGLVTTGLYQRSLKCKVSLLTGSIITALVTGLFGALQFLSENTLFLVTATLLRAIEAASCAMYHEAGNGFVLEFQFKFTIAAVAVGLSGFAGTLCYARGL